MSTPHKCPVCEGRRSLPAGYYALSLEGTSVHSSTLPETCRTCLGSGILWDPSTSFVRGNQPPPVPLSWNWDEEWWQFGGGTIAAGDCLGFAPRMRD